MFEKTDTIGLEAAIVTLSNEQKEIRKKVDTIAEHLGVIASLLAKYARRDGLISNKV